MSIRDILWGFGLKGGTISAPKFECHIQELCEGHETPLQIARSVPAARRTLQAEFCKLDYQSMILAKDDERTHQLMTIPGVGPLTSPAFVAAIDQTERFRSSRLVGAHFGLTPQKCQSGETDHSGRISKCGDRNIRTALFEAANVMMMRSTKASDLKIWARDLAKRIGMKQGKGRPGQEA